MKPFCLDIFLAQLRFKAGRPVIIFMLGLLLSNVSYAGMGNYLGEFWGAKGEARTNAWTHCNAVINQKISEGLAIGLRLHPNQSTASNKTSEYQSAQYPGAWFTDFNCGWQFSEGGWKWVFARAIWYNNGANGCYGYSDSDPFNRACYQNVSLNSEGLNPFSCPKRNPVDIMTGDKIETATDYQHASNDLMKFERVYNSKSGKWNFPFTTQLQDTSLKFLSRPRIYRYAYSNNRYLTLYAGKEIVELKSNNSRTMTFSKNGEKTDFQSITQNTGVEFSEKSSLVNGIISKEYVYFDGLKKETYNSEGKLKSIAQGEDKVNVAYDALTNTTDFSDDNGNGFSLLPFNGSAMDFQLVDREGHTITYEFTDGLLKTVTYPDATQKQYLYENAQKPNALTGVIDEKGIRYASWAYDSSGKANMSTHANDAERSDFIYDTLNSKVTETTIAGKKTIYWYYPAVNNNGPNGFNKIKRIEGVPSSNCLATDSYYSYDTLGYRKTLTDKNGNVTETIRNSRGLVETERSGLRWVSGVNSTLVETAASQKTVTEWHATLALPLHHTYYAWNGSAYTPHKKVSSTYVANNQIETFTVTDLTDIAQPYVTAGRTRVWNFTYHYYDAMQTQLQKQTVDGPRTDVSDITNYHYDTSGNLSSMTDAMNHQTMFSAYNSRGLVGSITDANGNSTAITYTLRGWIDVLTVNGTAQTNYDYYANGLLEKVTLPDGSWLNYQYNDARHLIKVSNHLGESITYTPNLDDGQWKQEVVRDSSSGIVRQRQRVFDELGRVMALQGQNGQIHHYSYDSNDNISNENDALQQVTSYQYDARNRISETLDAEQNAKVDTTDKHPVVLGYDGQDNIQSVTDQRGNTTRYVYDGFGELIQQTSPDTGITTFTYDAAGNLTGKSDAGGVNSTYQYDALNRLTAVIYPAHPDETVAFYYDNTSNGNKGLGQLTGYSANNLQTLLSYDAWGLASSTDCVLIMPCYTTAYNRNSQGQLVNMVYPSGNRVLYSYNSIGQVDGIKWQAYGQSPEQASVLANNIRYRPFSGSIEQLHYGNGVQGQFIYDADDRLENAIATGSAGVLYSKGYQYTPVDNISHINDNVQAAKTRSYLYDKNSRLTRENKGNGETVQVTTYGYDEVGNRNQRTRVTGSANPVINETLDYATESNRLMEKTDSAADNSMSYQYNAKGDIAEVVANPTGSIHYSYNAAGRMQVSNALAGDITQYTLNALGQRQIKMPNGDASLSTWYNFSPNGQLLAEHNLETQQVQAEYIYLNGLPIAYVLTQNGSNTIYNIINDHLATPQMLLDASQNIVWQADYDAFGQAGLPIEQVTFNLRFPGQYYDKETALHYNYYRDYDSSLGRYVQSDPIGLRGGINTFGYAHQSPLIFIDPYGLKPPSNIPDGVDINENIKKAACMSPVDFYKAVKNKGDWDYKQRGSQYEDFGNYNFGITGAASGWFPSQVLNIGAGVAQLIAGTSAAGWGNPFKGKPYGDDPNDQFWIDEGKNDYNGAYDDGAQCKPIPQNCN